MTKPYLITFTPVGKFYFGDSKGFDDDFYVMSNQFPQQSTVVGALRASIRYGSKLLFKHKRRGGHFILSKNWQKSKDLTGTSKIQNLFNNECNMGKIQSISPVFLTTKNSLGQYTNAYFPIPQDVCINPKEKSCKIFSANMKKGISYNCGKCEKTVFFSNCHSKKEYQPKLLCGKRFWNAYFENKLDLQDTIELHGKNSPFINHRQVGIGLNRKQVIDKQFYVKNDYSFSSKNEELSFGVICFLSENVKLANSITLGGEQSVFMIDKQPLNDITAFNDYQLIKDLSSPSLLEDDHELNINGPCKVVTLSPVISKDIKWLESSSHGIAKEISSLRMINPPGTNSIKTDAYRIFPAASVIYVQEGKTLKKPNIPLAIKIGLNKMIHIPVKSVTED